MVKISNNKNSIDEKQHFSLILHDQNCDELHYVQRRCKFRLFYCKEEVIQFQKNISSLFNAIFVFFKHQTTIYDIDSQGNPVRTMPKLSTMNVIIGLLPNYFAKKSGERFLHYLTVEKDNIILSCVSKSSLAIRADAKIMGYIVNQEYQNCERKINILAQEKDRIRLSNNLKISNDQKNNAYELNNKQQRLRNVEFVRSRKSSIELNKRTTLNT